MTKGYKTSYSFHWTSTDIKDRYPNIDDYNPYKKCKTFNICDMVADMPGNKTREPQLLNYFHYTNKKKNKIKFIMKEFKKYKI